MAAPTPFLSAVIMGRDEEEFIPKCLDSLAGVVDEIVFLDTGSVDRTVPAVIAHAHNAAPEVKLRHWEWRDDFSAARNEAARHATGRWVLSIDCDEYLAGRLREPGKLKQALLEFEREHADMWPRLFGKLPLFDTNLEEDQRFGMSQQLRLYPRHPSIRYEQPIHNRLILEPELAKQGIALLKFPSEDLHLVHRGYDPRVIKSKGKRARTKRILQKALETNRDGLHLYYLGREHHQLGEHQEAVEALQEARDWYLDRPDINTDLRLHGIWVYLLRALPAAGASIEAINQEAVRALETFPESTDLWYEAGLAHLDHGEPEAALRAFHEADRLLPQAMDQESSFLPFKAWELYQNQAAACAAVGDEASGRAALARAADAGGPQAEFIREYLTRRPVAGMVMAGMSTVPERSAAFELAVGSILPQVDRLHVYLDRWTGPRPEILDHPKVTWDVEPLGLMDLGKFRGMQEEGWDYYFTLDDDIHYPPNYVSRMVLEIEAFKRRVAIGVHGSNLAPGFQSYIRDRTILNFATEQHGQPVDVLGTGTVAFHRDLLDWSRLQPYLQNPGMADLDFSLACPDRRIIGRREGWLQGIGTPGESLYRQAHRDDAKQTQLAKQLISRKLHSFT